MKNIVLLMVDQMRFDAIGKYNQSKVLTPNLNNMIDKGYSFTHAYSATPTCVPARAALMTGLNQENHKRVGYQDGVEWDYDKTIASEFTDAGYYTKAIGKMHVYPPRKLMGYHHIELHDGYLHHSRKHGKDYRTQFEQVDDYLTWFKDKKGHDYDLIDSGLDCNSWVVKPWMYEEELHPTNWVVTRGLDFLKKRDPTKPFFLKLSFTRPHSPLDPPHYYYDLYKNRINLKDEEKADWSNVKDFAERTFGIDATTGSISDFEKEQMLAAYYGHVTHIDHQIGRFLIGMQEHDLDSNTVYLFVSDHGDQLGEHHLFRKAYPYQGSIHVPFILYDPANSLEGERGTDLDVLTELKDVFPTLIEIATGKEVSDIDGKSLLPFIRATIANIDKPETKDTYIHGEHEFGTYSNQYIVTNRMKYIWFSNTGEEQLFDLEKDPGETENMIEDENYKNDYLRLKGILIEKLKDREEGYVSEGKLVKGKADRAMLEE